jgi:threonine dehydrogenase-like Zn-dependent dehydrogenase
VAHARPGGTILVLANYWGEVRLPPALVAREVSLVPSFMYGHHHGAREFDEAVEVLTATPEIAEALVTHRFALDRAAEAFRTAADRAAGAIKVMLEP